MGFIKKVWKARKGEGLNKFSIEGENPVSIVNMPDNITQAGDAFTADNMNGLEKRIAEGCEDKIYKIYSAMGQSSIIETLPSSNVIDINIKGETVIASGKFVSIGVSTDIGIEIPIQILTTTGKKEATYTAKYYANGDGLLSVGNVCDELSYKDKEVTKRCEQIKLADLDWEVAVQGSSVTVFSNSNGDFLEGADYLVTPEFSKGYNYVTMSEFPNQILLEDGKIYISISNAENNVKDYLANTQTQLIYVKKNPYTYLVQIDEIIANSAGRFVVNIDRATYEVVVFDKSNNSGGYFQTLYKNKVGEKSLKGEIFNDYGNNVASEEFSHTEGYGNRSLGKGSHSEGGYTLAEGNVSHAEGSSSHATGTASHAEGYHTKATNTNSHAQGYRTTASGENAHAEGSGNEGNRGVASGKSSHSEGHYALASGDYSHAEGYNCTASGDRSHAEGSGTEARGNFSHAGGLGTIASEDTQVVIGKYNKVNADAVFIIGNGTSNTKRKNLFEILKDGRMFINGVEL